MWGFFAGRGHDNRRQLEVGHVRNCQIAMSKFVSLSCRKRCPLEFSPIVLLAHETLPRLSRAVALESAECDPASRHPIASAPRLETHTLSGAMGCRSISVPDVEIRQGFVNGKTRHFGHFT